MTDIDISSSSSSLSTSILPLPLINDNLIKLKRNQSANTSPLLSSPLSSSKMSSQSSPDTSPQHPWMMVPVLQTLTVLSDGEEMEQMEQKMGIDNNNLPNQNGHQLTVTKMVMDNVLNHHHQQQQQQQQGLNQQLSLTPQQQQQRLNNSIQSTTTPNYNQKRKVGRPITSVKTMNRSFPAVDEIRAKLEAGECYVRPRASSSSSDVWELFQEVAYKDNHVFTGIVQCKTCLFLTRYHGQITGTSHMRRHHCFSLLFPNSLPANRKSKMNQNNNNNAISIQTINNNNNRTINGNLNHNNNSKASTTTFNITDADSTTPRMLKRMKMNDSTTIITTTSTAASTPSNRQFNYHHLNNDLNNHNNNNQQTLLSSSPSSSSSSTSSLINNNNHITIHPTMPKRKIKNQTLIVGNHQQNDSRSLISNGNSNGIAITMTSATTTKSPSPSPSSSSSSQQSMLHSSSSSSSKIMNQNNGFNGNNNHSSSTSLLSIQQQQINSQKQIQQIRQDLREKIVQFCAEQLVPLQTIISDSFRNILQTHLRYCVQQMIQQFHQQQLQSQLMNTIIQTFLTYLNNHNQSSSLSSLFDLEQLQSYQLQLYCQFLDYIRKDLHSNLESNPGLALICDSDNDACILSVYYIDKQWKLIEAILSASGMVIDINRLVSRTLEDYGLQDRKKLNKFTFVSYGGQFGGVSVCLNSMAHIIDKVVDESLSILTDNNNINNDEDDDNDQNQSQKHPFIELFEKCHNLAIELNLQSIVDQSNPYDIDWINKYELLKVINDNQSLILETIDTNNVDGDNDDHDDNNDNNHESKQNQLVNFKLISILLKILEPFRTATTELRQCSKYPTLCYVLLYFYKLKKVLSSSISTNYMQLLYNNNSYNNNNNQNNLKCKSTVNNKKKCRKKKKIIDSNNNNSDSSSESDSNIEDDDNDDDEENVNGKSNGINNNDEDNDDKDIDDNDVENNINDDDNDHNNIKYYENLNEIIKNLCKLLMENLDKYYQIQSLHRIATFLWPNFRLLKMLTPDEQKEVHDDVRKLMQTKIKTNFNGKIENNLNNNNNIDKVDEDDDDNGYNQLDNNNDGLCNGLIDLKNSKQQNNTNNNNKSKSNFDEWEIFSDEDQDEVDKYLSVQLTSCTQDSILQWWREHSQEFPKLSQLAKWILSIPASVTTRERFKIMKNCQIDDMLLFLHCNMQTEKFDLQTMKRSMKTTIKMKNRNNSNNHNHNSSNDHVSAAVIAAAAAAAASSSSSSLIAQ